MGTAIRMETTTATARATATATHMVVITATGTVTVSADLLELSKPRKHGLQRLGGLARLGHHAVRADRAAGRNGARLELGKHRSERLEL